MSRIHFYGSNFEHELKITAVKVNNRTITHEELSDFLYHNLSYFHVPRVIEFKDELPKGPSTEVLKSILIREWDEKKLIYNTWDTQTRSFLK